MKTHPTKRYIGLVSVSMLMGVALTLVVQVILPFGTTAFGANEVNLLPQQRWNAAELASMELEDLGDIDWITVESGAMGNSETILFEGQNVTSVWQAGPAKILIEKPYTYDEIILILKGTLILTDTAGNSASYKEGDIFVVEEGFEGIWEMTEEYRQLSIIDTDIYNEAF